MSTKTKYIVSFSVMMIMFILTVPSSVSGAVHSAISNVVDVSSFANFSHVHEEGEMLPTKTTVTPKQLILAFFQTFIVISGLYMWGLSRNKAAGGLSSFRDMTSEAPKTFLKDPSKISDEVASLDPNLWYIHGDAYDLSDFMTRHPGGYRPLLVARGRDCTELFESYHSLTDKPRSIMGKFKVPGKSIPNTPMFNWDPKAKCNEFAVELKQAVREHVKNNKINTMTTTWNMTWCFLYTFFTMWVTYEYYWKRGELWMAFAMPVMWWISFIHTFHDATHFAYSRNEYITAFWVYLYPYFSSPTTWDHQHVIGHHVFTNIFKKDPDMNHGVPFMRIHPRFRMKYAYKLQMYTWWFIWGLSSFWLSTVYDWIGITSGSYHGLLPYQKLSKFQLLGHFFGRTCSVFFTTVIPFLLFPFWKALLFAYSFNAIFGWLFMLTTQINHLVEECIEGAQQKNECWAIHQVVTAHDFAHESWGWWLICGGLNFQIEHHLFPGVNNTHLAGLVPIVRGLCKKYDIPYNYSPTHWEAFCNYLRVVDNGSKDNSAEQKKK